MLPNLFSVLVDGAGYGGDGNPSSDDPKEAGFPRESLHPSPGKAGGRRSRIKSRRLAASRALPHGTENQLLTE